MVKLEFILVQIRQEGIPGTSQQSVSESNSECTEPVPCESINNPDETMSNPDDTFDSDSSEFETEHPPPGKKRKRNNSAS